MFKRKAVGNRIIVKLDKVEINKEVKKDDIGYKSKGGIALLESTAKKELDYDVRKLEGSETGVVISVGKSAYKHLGGDPWCKLGDHVGIKRYAGTDPDPQRTDKDNFYRCIDDEDVCYIIEE